MSGFANPGRWPSQVLNEAHAAWERDEPLTIVLREGLGTLTGQVTCVAEADIVIQHAAAVPTPDGGSTPGVHRWVIPLRSILALTRINPWDDGENYAPPLPLAPSSVPDYLPDTVRSNQ